MSEQLELTGFMPSREELRELKKRRTIRILIVEDDVNGMAVMLSAKLRVLKERFDNPEIILVGTFADGLRRVYEEPAPHVTFLDLGMPDSDWETTAQRAQEIEEKSPVVIVTGHKEHMVRPLLRNQLIEVIHKDSSMWSKIIPSIERALARAIGRRPAEDDEIRQNIEALRELIQHAP